MAGRTKAAKRAPKAKPRGAQLARYPKGNAIGRPLLGAQITPPKDASRQQRERFGRGLTLNRIEQCIRAAHSGAMRDITDLNRETIDFDPHISGTLPKRLRPLSRWDWVVEPAIGPGVNEARAAWYAEVVQGQLRAFNDFAGFLGTLAWALWDGRALNELVWVDGNGESRAGAGRITMAIADWQWVHPRRLNIGAERQLIISDDTYGPSGSFRAHGIDTRAEQMAAKFVKWTPRLFGEYVEREGIAVKCMYWSFMKRYAARERMILTELFGKPWRIVEVDEEANVQPEDIEAAAATADQMGATYTARMPRGLKLVVIRPDPGDGKLHRDTIVDVDAQMSKLLLGQTGTTDGVSSGLNSNQAEVMSGEQGDLHLADAALLSEVVESELTDQIIVVNFGEDELVNAPTFKLVAKKAKDKVREGARLKGALDAGLAVKVEEAYDAVGFSIPGEEDAVVRMEQPPTPQGALAPPAPRPIVVFRDAEPHPPGAVERPPTVAPTGDPKIDNPTEDTGGVQQVLNGAQLAVIMQIVVEVASGVLPRDSAIALAEIAMPGVPREVLERLIPEQGAQIAPEAEKVIEQSKEALAARARARLALSERMCCAADHRQPDGPNGNVESLLSRGRPEALRAMAGLVKHYQDAVAGKHTAVTIVHALSEASHKVDLRPLGRALERRMVQAAALGALDADDETDVDVKAAGADGRPDFASMPFESALKNFLNRKAIPRAQFDKLSGKARQRAFTVAGVVNEDALVTIQDELAKVIGEGGSLVKFGERIAERMKSAGFLQSLVPLADGKQALNASHVETVFRTNVLSAYNAGRAEQMRQPVVMAKFPVWEIRGVADDRTRKPHGHAHGKMLLASDPFWQTAYPPFGYQCRCRTVARGPKYLSQVVSGSTIEGLPDDGFTSGLGSLLAADPF